MPNKSYRTRQAPSPTGYLHLGTARTILFTKLFAMINNGGWFIRLEDTDRARLHQDSPKSLLNSLYQLGLNAGEGIQLNPDNNTSLACNDFYGIYQGGDYGPYIQSERVDLYKKYAQTLIDKKLAYWSYLTPEDKEDLQVIKKTTKSPINYFRENSSKFGDELLFQSVDKALLDNKKPALMFRILRDKKLDCYDRLLGKTEFDLNLEEDFTILKSDGFPTYHLAHVVDDFLMKTTEVIRSQEWFPSLPKHIVLFKELWGDHEPFIQGQNGVNVPDYIHLPFILGEVGNKKMSKRDGNVNMQDYLDKGFLPEAIINYLAFLGWNPGTEKELYLDFEDFKLDQKSRIDKLIANISQDFSLDKISKSPARFNLQKLEWLNKEYIKMLSLSEFVNLVNKNTETTLTKQDYLALYLDQNRITTLGEIGTDSSCIIDWQKPSLEDVKWKKSTIQESVDNLDEIYKEISRLYTVFLPLQNELYEVIFDSKFNEKYTECCNFWEINLKKWLVDGNKKVGDYLWPLRVMLSGKVKSPSPFELLSILSIEEVSDRLRKIKTT